MLEFLTGKGYVEIMEEDGHEELNEYYNLVGRS